MTNFVKHLFWNGFFAIALSQLFPLVVLAEATTLLVTKIDGTQLQGELIAWDASKLTLQSKDQAIAITSPQLLRAQWQHKSPNVPTQATFLVLVDGTRLPHHGYEVDQGQATITTRLAKRGLTLSTNQVEFVQLSPDAPAREQVGRVSAGDVLVIRKKKAGAFDHLTGILGDVSQKQVEFTWDGEAIPVKRSKVAALAYYHANSLASKEPFCWLKFREGGRLPVAKFTWTNQKLQVRTPGGFDFLLSQDELQEADFSRGKLAYLSDLTPLEQHWTPRIDLPLAASIIRQHGMPRRDQSYTGSALTLRWPATKLTRRNGPIKTYDKGLAVRSRTLLRYRLPKGMRRFVTTAGIDPETERQGHVTLEIFADRQSVWQGEIDGGSAPVEINVALGNARELRIVVDYGNNLDYGDRLHLVEARISQ